MSDSNAHDKSGADAALRSGLIGAVAAVAVDELVHLTPMGRIAGLAAAVVGSAVAYGVETTSSEEVAPPVAVAGSWDTAAAAAAAVHHYDPCLDTSQACMLPMAQAEPSALHHTAMLDANLVEGGLMPVHLTNAEHFRPPDCGTGCIEPMSTVVDSLLHPGTRPPIFIDY